MNDASFRLAVERVDRLSTRPWLFLTGRLEGDPIRLGELVRVSRVEGDSVLTTVRSIEIHSAQGMTTIAVDSVDSLTWEPGLVVTAAP